MGHEDPVRRARRDALMEAIIPPSGPGLPGIEGMSLEPFWARFEAQAPLHLKLGLRLAVAVIGGALPRAMGLGAGLEGLDPTRRERVIQRAARLPGTGELLEVARIVACLGYFADPGVQASVRGRA